MRLTDVDNLIDSIYADMNDDMDAYTNHDLVEKIIKKIDTAPIVDATPVIHAHQKEKVIWNGETPDLDLVCSHCGHRIDYMDGKYCKNCGAVFDEEADYD